MVDGFVLCEATVTQGHGERKPLYFADSMARFTRWLPRITAVGTQSLGVEDDPWAREAAQRNAIMDGLRWAGAGPDDVVMYSDVDEIPTTEAVSLAALSPVPLVFEQIACYYAVDWIAPWVWEGTCSCLMRDVTTIAGMREARSGWQHLMGAGFHLSWLGGPEGIRRKLADRAHTDETGWYLEALERGELYEQGIVRRTYGGDPVQMEAAEVDASWPRWIAEGHAPASWFRPRKG